MIRQTTETKMPRIPVVRSSNQIFKQIAAGLAFSGILFIHAKALSTAQTAVAPSKNWGDARLSFDFENGRADLQLSFGAMVWPHMLVRVMLAEQLYRAATILAGGPYHRA